VTDGDFDEVVVALYNPLGRSRKSLVHIPVKDSGRYEVVDEAGIVVFHQVRGKCYDF
jgi:hypothetical protein